MNRLKIGVHLESLNLPLRQALSEVRRMEIAGVQIDAVGDLSPNKLSQSGRRELRHLLRSHNLELTAVGCPLRHGLDDAVDQQPRIEHMEKTLALSFDLGPRIVIVNAGKVPEDVDAPRYQLLKDALLTLGRVGDRTGTTLALETGLECGALLASFLDRCDTGSLAVNLDAANLMVNGFDIVESMRALRGRIVHTHLKDVRRANPSATREVPLGHGDIDWMEFLGVLEEIEYRGWLTIDRESGEDRLADVTEGVAFLRRLL